jgi:cysteine desulfurase family protein
MNDRPIYLNNAATTYPKPPCVLEAVEQHLRSLPADGRGADRAGDDDLLPSCRAALARFFGAARPSCVIFTSGATESLNLLIAGAPLAGGHVITTEAEHNSVLRPLSRLAKEGSISLTIVPCTGGGAVDPSAIADALRPETRAVVMTHCSNVTGAVNDLRAIGAMTRERGVLLFVDASQSAGVIPLEVDAWGIDGVAASGHKGMFGIAGTGFALLRQGLPLRPLKTGGTGSRSELLDQPPEWPAHFESGTPNGAGIAALRAGLQFVESFPAGEAVRCRQTEMLYDGLADISGVTVFGAPGDRRRLPVCAFAIKGIDVDETSYILSASFGITTRAGLHCAPLIHRRLGATPEGSVRVSPSRLTPDDDVAAFLNAVRTIAGAQGERP